MDTVRGNLDLTTITALRDGLPLFNKTTYTRSSSGDNLYQYLNFYQLPLPTDRLTLHTGTTEDGQIALMSWEPATSVGTVLIVHGYMDHIGLYGHLIRALLSRQLTVLCFDAKGHGLSAGKPCSISHFSEYVDRLTEIVGIAQEHFTGPLHGIGQSMGGAVLIKHLINHSPTTSYPFATLNLLAPLLQPWGWKQSRRLYHLTRWFLKSIKRVFRASSWDQDFLDFLRTQDPLQPRKVPTDWVGAMDQWISEFHHSPKNDYPVHIIQGNHDKTLDWEYNLARFKDKLPSASMTMIEQANHHLVNESEPLRKKIFSALKL